MWATRLFPIATKRWLDFGLLKVANLCFVFSCYRLSSSHQTSTIILGISLKCGYFSPHLGIEFLWWYFCVVPKTKIRESRTMFIFHSKICQNFILFCYMFQCNSFGYDCICIWKWLVICKVNVEVMWHLIDYLMRRGLHQIVYWPELWLKR